MNEKRIEQIAELYRISGKDPVLWSVPFWVLRRQEEMVAIVEACHLVYDQRRAVRRRLEKLPGVEYMSNKRFWTMHYRTLQQIGEKQRPGTDPLSLFVWDIPNAPEEPLPPKQNASSGNTDVDEFLASIASSGVADMGTLCFWWRLFCDAAQRRLINEEKPVPMFFIKLHNSPYRQNWKFILLTRWPKFWRTLTYMNNRQKRLEYANEVGFLDDMLSLDMLAMQRGKGVIYRYVEVEHCRAWHKTVRKAELFRLKQLGWVGYATNVLASVKRRLLPALRQYGQWLADCAVPCAGDIESDSVGNIRLAPHIPSTPVDARGLRTFFIPAVVANKMRFKPASKIVDLWEKADPLPDQVPPVQPGPGDLRNSGTDLPKPANGETGTPRVLVPLDPKELTPDSSVLAELEDEWQRRLEPQPKRQQ